MDKLKNFFNHERYQAISIIIAITLLIWFYGCKSQVRSLVEPTRKITRTELQAEVDFFLASAEIRFADLDRQDEFKQVLLESALIYGQTGTVNPFSVIITLASVLGVGAAADNVRKRKLLKSNVTAYVDEQKKKANT